MTDIEQRLRAARPDWPAAPERTLPPTGRPHRGRSPHAWSRRGRGLAAVVGLAVVAGGATLAVSLIGGSGAAAAPGAVAATAFGPTETVGRTTDDASPAVALGVDDAGRVVVAWERAGRILVAERPRGGPWTSPAPVSAPTLRSTSPSLAAGADGRIVVVWRERSEATVVRERFTLPSGAPAGVLRTVTGRRWVVRARVHEDGRWTGAARISPPAASVDELEDPKVVMTADGTVVAAWDRAGEVYSVERAPGGTWSAPTPLGDRAGEPVQVALAVQPGGDEVVVAWGSRKGTWTDPGGERRLIQVASRGPDGAWTPAVSLVEGAQSDRHVGVALARDGSGIVQWTPLAPPDPQGQPAVAARAAVRTASGTWSAPETAARRPPANTSGFFAEAAAGLATTSGRAFVVAIDRRLLLGRYAPGAGWTSRALGARPWAAATAADRAGGGLILAGMREGTPTTRVLRVDGGGAVDTVAELPGVGSGLAAAVGKDGTAAAGWYRARMGGADVVVAVAEPGGRP